MATGYPLLDELTALRQERLRLRKALMAIIEKRSDRSESTVGEMAAIAAEALEISEAAGLNPNAY